jgi:hypothetical protein
MKHPTKLILAALVLASTAFAQTEQWLEYRTSIPGDQVGERFRGQLQEVDERSFQIEVARDGAFVKAKKVENLVLGQVSVPENISEFTVYGTNGHYVRKPVSGKVTLPVGTYQISQWSINRKDEKGALWMLMGRDFPSAARFEVAGAKPAVVDIGEPVQAVLKVDEYSGRQVHFGLKFVGKQSERVTIHRTKEQPTKPKLTIVNADGTQCYNNSFEYG